MKKKLINSTNNNTEKRKRKLKFTPLEQHNNSIGDLAKRIKYLRVKHNLSQQELANRMGKDKTLVYRIESGKHDTRYTTLVATADAMEVPLSSITNIKTHNQKILYCTNHKCKKFNQHIPFNYKEDIVSKKIK